MTTYTFANLDEAWDLEDEEQEDDIYPNKVVADLFANAVASDFYFTTCTFYVYDGWTKVSITPKAYFDKHQYMFDQPIPIDHLLPKDLADNEIMEGVWACERSIQDVRKDLIARGFYTCNAFDKLVAKSEESAENDD